MADFLNISPTVRLSLSTAPLAWGCKGKTCFVSIPSSFARVASPWLSNSQPRSVRKDSGIPCLQNTSFTRALATVSAVLFGIGTSSAGQ